MRQLTYFELSWAIHAGCKLLCYIFEATLAVQSYCSLQGEPGISCQTLAHSPSVGQGASCSEAPEIDICTTTEMEPQACSGSHIVALMLLEQAHDHMKQSPY